MLANVLRDSLMANGALLVGYGDLAEVDEAARHGLPMGVCIAVRDDGDVISGISEWPTQAYLAAYHRLNQKLDELATHGAQLLQSHGFRAVAHTRATVSERETMYSSPLPHKTVATRAGLGWIGKCALLVTEEYGSMVRITSILTDAPLPAASPINESRCGGCEECKKACPAGAVSGEEWSVKKERDEFFSAALCRQTARERALKSLGEEIALCGRCIAACPHTVLAIRR